MKALTKAVNLSILRGIISVVLFVALWQLVVVLKVPYLEYLPFPKEVALDGAHAAVTKVYWFNWGISLQRIFIGFIAAQLIGIPVGMAMGMSRVFRDFTFPLFEILRPIPPIAWIPIGILYWPTRELSIYFLVFIGAFFIIVINVLRGVSNISVTLTRAASSLGGGRATFSGRSWSQARCHPL